MATIEQVLKGEARWTVVHGEALATLASMPSGSIDALITDPPYSSGGQFRGDRANGARSKYVRSDAEHDLPDFSGDNRDQRAYAFWCSLWLSEAQRVAKPGAPFCLFTDWRQLPTTTDLLQAGGLVWRGIMPWDKGEGTRPVMGRPRAQCEYVVWGSNGPMPTDRAAAVMPGVVRESAPSVNGGRLHITEKPVAVMRAVNAITERGGVILDPFFGSGSTGEAALLDGYRVIGIEREATYAAIAQERLEAVSRGLTLAAARTGQTSIFERMTSSTGDAHGT